MVSLSLRIQGIQAVCHCFVGTFLLQWKRASRYPEKAKCSIALCCTGAQEHLSQEQRENRSLELSSFLGAARSPDFSSSPERDSQPLQDCVLLMWSQLVVTPASHGESLCPHCRFCFHTDPRSPRSPMETLGVHVVLFFFSPHKLLLMRRENGTAWYRSYSLSWSVQESLFKELPLSSAVCSSLIHSSLRWQTRLKIVWKQLGAISCDPSPQSMWQWWQDFCQGG